MIHTETSFSTNDKRLQALYDGARALLLSSVKPFGDRRILTEGAASDTATLQASILGASTLACYDLEAALDTVKAFLATVNHEGRPADSIICRDGEICPSYSVLTGFCFAGEALGLYYLLRKKDAAYLESLLRVLLDFDAYLWEQHDLNFDGCLEVFNPTEAEDEESPRFSPVMVGKNGEQKTASPFPVESSELMACDVAVRRTISAIYSLKGDEASAANWMLKAGNVQAQLKKMHWSAERSACFDRDCRGNVIDCVDINHLYMMCCGALDEEMANAFRGRHLQNPRGFFTPMPLPTVSASDRNFKGNGTAFCPHPRGLTYRRAINALENYGQYSLLSRVGGRLLSAVDQTGVFSERYDTFSAEPLGKPEHMATASAVLETIAEFFGIRPRLDRMIWGALGHRDSFASDYRFTWGCDAYHLACESSTTIGSINGEPLFTVTNGVRVTTDLHGNEPQVANITDGTIDCVFVYRNRIFSFTLGAGEIWELE